MSTNTEEKLFQCYSACRQSFKMLTDTGRAIIFVEGQFITDDEQLIEYLDKEVAAKHPWVTKGKPVSSKDVDPMSRLKDKIIAEYEAEKAAQAETQADILKADPTVADAGNTETKPASLGAVNTDILANLKAKSGK